MRESATARDHRDWEAMTEQPQRLAIAADKRVSPPWVPASRIIED